VAATAHFNRIKLIAISKASGPPNTNPENAHDEDEAVKIHGKLIEN